MNKQEKSSKFVSTKTVGLIVIMWFSFMFGAWAQAAQSKSSTDAVPPVVIAVKFYADWCSSCKVMATTYKEFQTKFDTQPVLHVVLDHTRKYDRQQSAYLAVSLGLGKVWEKYANKTGFILLVDGKTREVITTLTKNHTLKEMGVALQKAVDKASSSL